MARERLLKPGGVFAAYEYCVPTGSTPTTRITGG